MGCRHHYSAGKQIADGDPRGGANSKSAWTRIALEHRWIIAVFGNQPLQPAFVRPWIESSQRVVHGFWTRNGFRWNDSQRGLVSIGQHKITGVTAVQRARYKLLECSRL